MPDKIIEIPNVGRIAFPDSMTPDQINAAAGKLYADKNLDHPSPDPKHSWVDTAVDWLPTATGAVGGLIGSTAGPLGAVAGAALGGAAGQAVKGTVQAARTGQDAPSLAEAGKAVAGQAALQGGAEAGGRAIGAGMAAAGPALMQSAVKPGLKATARALFGGTATEDLPIVKTLLKEGVNVSPGGIAKLDRIISASNDEIKAAIAHAKGLIYPEAVAARVDPVIARASQQVNPVGDVAAAKDAAREFLTSRGGPNLPATPLTVPEAQALKTGTYQSLKEKAYGELKAPAIEAQKALARGLKEDIEQQAAQSGIDIATPNAREGAVITAKEAIAKRLAAAGNRDPGSLAWLAHNPTAGLLFVMERSPAVKSMLARGLYQSAGAASGVSPQVIRGLVEALTSQQNQP